MTDASCTIRRPRDTEQESILRVLKTCNFHHIGGREMPSFPLEDCFIAIENEQIVGVAGYRILDSQTAKTTLLAVLPKYRGHRIGARLHGSRIEFLRSVGIRTVFTNVDDDRVVDWYKRNFGYCETGERIPKVESFGRPDKQEWINLKVEL